MPGGAGSFSKSADGAGICKCTRWPVVRSARSKLLTTSRSCVFSRCAVTLFTTAFIGGVAAKATLLPGCSDRPQRSARDMANLQQALFKAPVVPSRVTALQKEIKALEFQIGSTLIVRETPKPRPTHIQLRGDFLQLQR